METFQSIHGSPSMRDAKHSRPTKNVTTSKNVATAKDLTLRKDVTTTKNVTTAKDLIPRKDVISVKGVTSNGESKLVAVIKRDTRRRLLKGKRREAELKQGRQKSKGFRLKSSIDSATRGEVKRRNETISREMIRRVNVKRPKDGLPYLCLANLKRYRRLLKRKLEKQVEKEKQKQEKPEEQPVEWDDELKTITKPGKDDNVTTSVNSDTQSEGADMADRDTIEQAKVGAGEKTRKKTQKPVKKRSRNFVIWQSDQVLKRRKLFAEILEPSVRSIVKLWQQMAPITSQTGLLRLMPSSSATAIQTSRNIETRNRRLIYCDWRDRNEITQGYYFIPNYYPTAHEWSVIGASVSAIVSLGPFGLSMDGLCFILEAIALRAICEAADRGTLNLPHIHASPVTNIARDDSFFMDTNVGRGLALNFDEIRAVDLCCYEVIRKWKIATCEDKYRVCISLRTIGFKNPYLHNLIVDDWRSILKGGEELERKLSQRKAKKATTAKPAMIEPNDGQRDLQKLSS